MKQVERKAADELSAPFLRAAALPHDSANDRGGELLLKYRELTAKYEKLVRKREMQSVERSAIFNWAMRTTSGSLAVVREERVTVTNQHWDVLGSDCVGGWHPSDSSETNSRENIFETLREVATAEARQLVRKGRASTTKVRYRSLAARRTVELWLENVTSPGGKSVVMVLARDITERVQNDEELSLARYALKHKQRFQVVGEIASGVTHDLKNALHGMALQLALLERQTECPITGGVVTRLSGLVQDSMELIGKLQDLSRPEMARRLESIDLARAINDAVSVAEAALEPKHGMRLEVNLPVLPSVRGTSTGIRHVFLNLLLNARDASPPGGTIHIGGRVEKRWVIVTVRDEGAGIPRANLERIFEPFFSTKGAQGMGLGLTQARDTMRVLGGGIRASNWGKQGAIFTLKFPALIPNQPVACGES